MHPHIPTRVVPQQDNPARSINKKAVERVLRHAPDIHLVDESAWHTFIAQYNVGFGCYLEEFSRRWARLMQVEINDHGSEVLPEIAEACQRDADWDKVTAFMLKRSVALLSETWVHGDRLEKWHVSQA